MKTVIVDGREADDLRWPMIITGQGNCAFPARYQDHVVLGSERLEPRTKQVHVRMTDRHLLPIRQSCKAKQPDSSRQPTTTQKAGKDPLSCSDEPTTKDNVQSAGGKGGKGNIVPG